MPNNQFVEIPDWAFENKGYYLVQIASDGRTGLDGSHDDPQGVAEAKKITVGLWPKKASNRFYMIHITDVPEMTVEVNEEAIETLAPLLAKLT